MISFRKLKYFVVLADSKSFTRAAETLCIAQPALSKHIKELEEEVGSRLIVRNSRPLVLTAAGQFFYEKSKAMLLELEETMMMTKKIGGVNKTLTVGFVASSLYTALPTVIKQIKDLVGIEVHLVEMNTMSQIAALKAGTLDIGFGRLQLHDVSVESEVLYEEGLHVAVPKDFAHLTQRGDDIRLVDLVDLPLIIFPEIPRPSFMDIVLQVFQSVGLTPKNIIPIRELQLALGLVAAGEGVCIVPSSFERLQRSDIAYIPLKEVTAKVHIVMNTRAHDHSPIIQQIKTIAKNVYGVW